MKKLVTFLLLTVLLAPGLWAKKQQVRDLDISITLTSDGNAVFLERWEVNTGDEITEWYLVRKNLGDITISSFKVYDDGEELQDDGEWDVDRTRAQKAGKYGIVHKNDGVELCWGVGDYGDHIFHAMYVMERAVKSLNDYDMLHLQVVSPGLASPPEHVKVTVKKYNAQLDTTNTRIWGFGFIGNASFQDGEVVYESSQQLGKEDSVIILLRLNKGLIDSPSVQERDFQEALDTALKGSSYRQGDYEEEEEPGFFIYLLATLIIGFGFWRAHKRVENKLKLGFKPKEAPFFRDVPMKGDLPMANFILEKSKNLGKGGGLAQAIILRLIHNGYMKVNRELEGPVTFSFTDKDITGLDQTSATLMNFLIKASGEDHILQEKEFKKWADDNGSTLANWYSVASMDAVTRLKQAGWYNPDKYKLSTEGMAEARKLIGLKNFLSEFTLIDQREAFEVNLWKEYLVYGSLFGIADRVAKQLKEIDPALFKQAVPYEDYTSVYVVTGHLMQSITDSISTYHYEQNISSSSSSGYGGSTSHGGGGGFSGGGHGGGGR